MRLVEGISDPTVHRMDSLPFVDEHSRHLRATPERAWEALMQFTSRTLERAAPATFVALWDLEPKAGFAVAEKTPPRHVALRGKHRFSRYELAFDLVPDGDGVNVVARTSAEFPGFKGRAYRALVIGSGGHKLAVGYMLRQVARRAER